MAQRSEEHLQQAPTFLVDCCAVMCQGNSYYCAPCITQTHTTVLIAWCKRANNKALIGYVLPINESQKVYHWARNRTGHKLQQQEEHTSAPAVWQQRLAEDHYGSAVQLYNGGSAHCSVLTTQRHYLSTRGATVTSSHNAQQRAPHACSGSTSGSRTQTTHTPSARQVMWAMTRCRAAVPTYSTHQETELCNVLF